MSLHDDLSKNCKVKLINDDIAVINSINYDSNFLILSCSGVIISSNEPIYIDWDNNFDSTNYNSWGFSIKEVIPFTFIISRKKQYFIFEKFLETFNIRDKFIENFILENTSITLKDYIYKHSFGNIIANSFDWDKSINNLDWGHVSEKWLTLYESKYFSS